MSIVVYNHHLSHNYTCFKSPQLITFPICKNCICFISLTSSMYMILYFQWQFNQCSNSKTKSLDCGPTPSTLHILRIIILHINLVSDTKESSCKKGKTYVHVHKAAIIRNVSTNFRFYVYQLIFLPQCLKKLPHYWSIQQQ